MENYTQEIGKRFMDITNKLNEMGVFYGNNYSGEYHDKYPHSSYWFSMNLDKHRNMFESHIMCDGDVYKTVATVHGTEPGIMIIELLEKSYNFLLEDLKNED